MFTDSVFVFSKSINNPTITGNLTICSGQSTTLDAGTGFDSYNWQPNGETSQTISVSSAGNYTVTVKKGNCLASSTVNVTSTNAPATFSLGRDTTICGTINKILSTGNQTTNWSTGATGSQITVTNSGTYIATISNSCGSVSDTIVINSGIIPIFNLGNDSSFCFDEFTLSIGNINYRSILWSTGATTQSIIATTGG